MSNEMGHKVRLIVKAGPHARKSCPVSTELPIMLQPGAGAALRSPEGKLVHLQVIRAGAHGQPSPTSGCRVAWILDELPARSEREYQLELQETKRQDSVAV